MQDNATLKQKKINYDRDIRIYESVIGFTAMAYGIFIGMFFQWAII